jgi:hypothetical protein
VVLFLGCKREETLVRDWEKAAVESFGKITIVRAYRVVDGDEVGSGSERPLNHYLGESRADRRQDVPTAQHRCPNRHEVGHSVVAIADQLREERLVCGRKQQAGDSLLGDCWQSMPMNNINTHNLAMRNKTYNCLSMVELHPSSQPALCKETQLRNSKLVHLFSLVNSYFNAAARAWETDFLGYKMHCDGF